MLYLITLTYRVYAANVVHTDSSCANVVLPHDIRFVVTQRSDLRDGESVQAELSWLVENLLVHLQRLTKLSVVGVRYRNIPENQVEKGKKTQEEEKEKVAVSRCITQQRLCMMHKANIDQPRFGAHTPWSPNKTYCFR